MLNSVINIFYLVTLVFVVTRSTVVTHKLSPPAPDFTSHAVVQPVLLHGRTKRKISTTRDTINGHHVEVTIKVPIDGKEYILDLRLNQDLVTDNHVLSYQKNGKTVIHKPQKEEIDFCHYRGSVRDKPGSWAAVSTCHGIQGMIFDGERVRYIEPAQEGDISAEHYIYDQSDLTQAHPNRYAMANSSQYTHTKRTKNRHKRYIANHKQLFRVPYPANERSLYVELVLVADRQHYETHNYNLNSVYKEMKAIANLINAVYSPLNIFVALVGVVVWNDYNKIGLEANSEVVLNNFVQYRRTKMAEKNILNDFAFLITHQQFEDDVVGKAYVREICTHKSSGGVGNYHTKIVGLMAMTVAHELGHSFGMEHDTEENCDCQEEKCIMNPKSTAFIPTGWSSCSLQALVATFSKGMDYCLRNKPKSLYSFQTCGNGFVEPGEQCDCGTLEIKGESNLCQACCDASTCRLRANATCAAGACCDLKTCRPKSVGTTCRPADRECDLPEYCNGDSEYCPDDVYKMDTTPCGSGEESAYCVDGGCQSHSGQCRLLWGSAAKSCPIQNYNYNAYSSVRKGDCGYNLLRETYKQCDQRNVKCGRLICNHYLKAFVSSFPQIGVSTFVRGVQFTAPNKVMTCHITSIDMGLSVADFGMVPDGAQCGDGMMCLKQECVSVAVIRKRIAGIYSSVCPSNCSGHGVCNSAGHCHCETGFSPPLCAEPGPGGSYDSGPASDSSILRKLMVALYVIFLGIVPTIALILLIIYCCRNKGFKWTLKYKCKLSFKSKEIKNLKKNVAQESPIYANTEVLSMPSATTGNTVPYRSSSIIYANIEEVSIRKNLSGVHNNIENPKKFSPTVPSKVINKNYKDVNIGPVKTKQGPPVKPRPNLVKISSTNQAIVHIKGLKSTTNDRIGRI